MCKSKFLIVKLKISGNVLSDNRSFDPMLCYGFVFTYVLPKEFDGQPRDGTMQLR